MRYVMSAADPEGDPVPRDHFDPRITSAKARTASDGGCGSSPYPISMKKAGRLTAGP